MIGQTVITQHTELCMALTLRPGEEEKTGDISNASMLDEEFTNINMMIKYYKFGFGRTTDIVNEIY